MNAEGARFRLRLLGEFEAAKNGRPLKLQAQQAAVMITIALAGPVSVADVCRHMTDGMKSATVHTQVSKIEAAGFAIDKVNPGKGVRYSLDRERYEIDSDRFMNAVDALGVAPETGALDALLAMWEKDPLREHPQVDRQLWNSVFAARDDVIDRVAELDPERRADLGHLSRFAAIFPDDPKVRRIRPFRDRPPRGRILVVEDQVGDMIKDELEESGYDCLLVATWEGWRNLKTEGLPLLDGAIVDLHLMGEDDALGTRVLGYLRDETDVPAAVVTSDPGRDSHADLESWKAEFRVVDLIDKHGKFRYLRQMGKTADLLAGTDDRSRRRRMETWVATAVRETEREAEGGGDLAKRRLRRCRREATEARKLIESGPVEQAQRAVDDLCRQFPPRARH